MGRTGSGTRQNKLRSGLVVLGAVAFGYLSFQVGFKPFIERAQEAMERTQPTHPPIPTRAAMQRDHMLPSLFRKRISEFEIHQKSRLMQQSPNGKRIGHETGDAVRALMQIGYRDEVPEFPAGLSKMGRDFLDRCLRRCATKRWTNEELL